MLRLHRMANASMRQASRTTVTNRYQYDYSVEDGYFEKEMTLLEAKTTPLPIPEDFKHKRLPVDTMFPAHMNDVRFNFKPENWGRRCFVHDTFMNSYDIDHDIEHSLGYRDEDLDYELPDPFDAMHFKKKRSPFFAHAMMIIWIGLFFGYAIIGLKIPQKDNPTFWRKKYVTPGAINDHMEMAWFEENFSEQIEDRDRSMLATPKGLKMVNNGLRFNVDTYKDFVC